MAEQKFIFEHYSRSVQGGTSATESKSIEDFTQTEEFFNQLKQRQTFPPAVPITLHSYPVNSNSVISIGSLGSGTHVFYESLENHNSRITQEGYTKHIIGPEDGGIDLYYIRQVDGENLNLEEFSKIFGRHFPLGARDINNNRPSLATVFRSKNQQVAEKCKEELDRSKWWKHRSTWMSLALLLCGVVLILAFTVASPAIEILLLVFGILVFVPKAVAVAIAWYDAIIWLITQDDWRNHFFNWAKNNKEQVIIAGIGVGLSLIGIGLFIGFAPALVPALTAACGCSVFMFALYLVGYGPVTIADAINRLLDRNQAEKTLEDIKDPKSTKYTPTIEQKNREQDPAYNYKVILSKEVPEGDLTNSRVNNASVVTLPNNKQ